MFLTLSVGSFLDGTFITKYLKREKIHPTRISGGIRWQKRVEIDL